MSRRAASHHGSGTVTDAPGCSLRCLALNNVFEIPAAFLFWFFFLVFFAVYWRKASEAPLFAVPQVATGGKLFHCFLASS